ncbi:MAG TPA: response regulator [Chitinophagaceae bacterium]|nr:response regulator [Chitinophagaceae bacterium]
MPNAPRILVIDDDKEDQAFLIDSIKELYPSYQCHAADNGQEALDYIKQNPPPPTYIFLDLNMPLVNGFEFLKEFKKDKNNKDSTVIIYSTSSHPRDKEISMDLGASAYITKISDTEKLKMRLKSVITN